MSHLDAPPTAQRQLSQDSLPILHGGGGLNETEDAAAKPKLLFHDDPDGQ